MNLFAELKRRNVIRVAIAYGAVSWFLVQVVETILPVFGFSDEPIRLVIILLLIGFPIALLLSWVYELTPDGLMKEKDIHPAQSITAHTGKKLDRAIIVVLALSLAYFAVDKFILDPARDAERERLVAEQARSESTDDSYDENSIAVLPFVNMSSDAEQEYFSDGISEELLNLLSKIPGLRVISRSSSFTFKDKDLDIPTIAQQLGVAMILEGSVRKSGEQIRITAQLIEARSDTHLWSETYDRELSNIFAVQDDISTSIVAALKTELGLEFVSAPLVVSTTNSQAHEAYLRGRYLLTQRTNESVAGAIDEFSKAIELDPEYALAHAELAIAIIVGFYQPFNELTQSEMIERVTPLIQKAMALDPEAAPAYAAAGLVRRVQSREDRLDYYKIAAFSNEALTFYQKAIELNPNYSEAYQWQGSAYNMLGRRKERFEAVQNAVQLDPLNVSALARHYQGLFRRNRMEEAERVMEKLSSISPQLASAYTEWALWERADWPQLALIYLDEALAESKPVHSHNFSDLMSRLGLEKEVLAGPKPLHLLQAFRIGQPEEAIRQAEESLAIGPSDDDSNPEWTYGFIMACAGDFELARPYLETGWDHMGRQLMFGHSDMDAFSWLAANLHAGDQAAFNEVLDRFRERVNYNKEAGFDYNRAWFDEGMLLYLDGEKEHGLKLIAKAVENGYQLDPTLAFFPYLLDGPGYQRILEKFEAMQTEQRGTFLSAVCEDNPYNEVWQPQAGTCDLRE